MYTKTEEGYFFFFVLFCFYLTEVRGFEAGIVDKLYSDGVATAQ